MAQATVSQIDPKTGQPIRKVVNVGDPNAFAGGYSLEERITDPNKQYKTTYDVGGVKYGLNPMNNTANDLAYPGSKEFSDAAVAGTLPGQESKTDTRYTSELDQYGELLKSRMTGGKTDAEIQAEERNRIQTQIDALENYWSNTVLPELQQEGKVRLGQSRGIQAVGGLMGSPMGAAQTDKTKQYTNQLTRAERAKIDAKIAALYEDADTRAIDRAEKQATLIRSDQDAYYAYLSEQQDASKNSLIDIFSGGVDINDLKSRDPEKYKQLLANAGIDELMAESLYNANSPLKQGNTYEYKELKNGEFLQIGSDGTIKSLRGPELDADWELKSLTDGTLVKLNTKTGDIEQYGAQGQFAKPKSTSDSSSSEEKDFEKIIKSFNSKVSDYILKLDSGVITNSSSAVKSIKAEFGDYFTENEIKQALGVGNSSGGSVSDFGDVKITVK